MGSVWYGFKPLMTQVGSCTNVTMDMKESLKVLVQHVDEQNRFSQPMLWIGIYIALASLVCTLLLLADIFSFDVIAKPWHPCRYFRLNAFSLSVIAVAMKLPMDLNNAMPGSLDQAAKIGSMAFMCTIMANLLPSLSTMDTNALLANITALGVLVFTLVVNICIQINTGVISYQKPGGSESLFARLHFLFNTKTNFNILAAIFYVAMLLMLLMMYICSALAILKSKQILESKYQACHKETSLQNQELQQSGRYITIQKLKELVRNHWIMTATGNPQFMASNSITTTASGVMCAISTFIFITFLPMAIESGLLRDYKSDYDWSIPMILMIQFVGTVLGAVVPIVRSCRLSYR